jgi:hypothetical protein
MSLADPDGAMDAVARPVKRATALRWEKWECSGKST